MVFLVCWNNSRERVKMEPTSEFKERFEEEIQILLHERVGIAGLVGAFVFTAFIFEDHMLAPEEFGRMAFLRLVAGLTCILFVAVNKTSLGRKYPFYLTMVAVTALSLLKTFINPVQVGGLKVLYFGGHALLLVGAIGYLPLTFKRAILVGLTIILCYAVPTVALGRQPHMHGFNIQIGLLVCIWVMLTLRTHMDYRMRLREFDLRWKLYHSRQRGEEYG